MPHFIVIALATFVTEDLTCIATGVLVAQRRLDFFSGSLACLIGIYFGDLLLFLAGRYAGRPAVRSSFFQRFVSPSRLDEASAWLSAKGAAVVFASRFVPGLRLPTYFAAGVLRTRFWRFAGYFLIAAAIWTPLLVGLTVVLGGPAVRTAFLAGGRGVFGIIAAAVVLISLRRLLSPLASFRSRRKLVGFLKRKVRWEFWPPWAAYLPLVPYLAWLTLKHRSATLFTAANPGMPSGGFIGESKSQILGYLERVEGSVAAFDLISGSLEPAARIWKARAFMDRRGFAFPVVLKPDVGERGSGVAIIASQAELESYLRRAACDTIIQRYVEGLEFGVFYYRHPDETTGHILSITRKTFPEIIGDGKSNLEELILRDDRAVCLATTYLSRSRFGADYVPAAGEPVRLAELGSHCRGAAFLDGRRLKTASLEAAIDTIGKAHPGFYLGRFDIRVPSLDDFQQGRSLQVIELNGVTGEATHIYDPAVSLIAAYRSMYTQWRMAFEIGAANCRMGARPMPAAELLRLIWSRFRKEEKRARAYDRAVQVVD